MENQPKSRNNSKEVIALLAKRFPLCFTTLGAAWPLKIGIFQDLVLALQENGNVSKSQLRSALRLYTSSWRYLYSVIKSGAERIDLEGNRCGLLEDEHVKHARQQLSAGKAQAKIKRAEQEAQKLAIAAVNKLSVTKETVTKPNDLVTQESKSANKNVEVTTKLVTNVAIKKSQSGKLKHCSNSVQDANLAKALSKKPSHQQAKAVDIATLKCGQALKIKIGHSIMSATVLEVLKDGIRVQLVSGLALLVQTEHLLC